MHVRYNTAIARNKVSINTKMQLKEWVTVVKFNMQDACINSYGGYKVALMRNKDAYKEVVTIEI